MNVDLVDTLLRLEREHATGVVEVGSGDTRTRLFMDAGIIVLAEEGSVGETLGRILLNGSVLTAEAYSQVIEKMAQDKGKRQRFGDVVVEMGLLTQAQVDAALSAQVRQKVIRCVRAEGAAFSFKQIPPPPKSMGRFPVRVSPLVLFALRMGDRDALTATLGGGVPHVVTLLDDVRFIAEQFDLRPIEERFLGTVDGNKELGALLEESKNLGVDVAVLLAALVVTGRAKLVRVKQASVPPARLSELIAMPQHLKRLRPSRTKRRSRAARAVARRLVNEWKKLKQAAPPPPRRRFPTPAEDWQKLLIGEAAFLRGKQLVQEARFADARPELAMAASLVPQAAEYALYAAWAELRADPAKEPEGLSRLGELAKRASDEDPHLAIALEVLAHVAMREGHFAESGKYLERARQLAPPNGGGRIRVRMLPRKKPFVAEARAASATATGNVPRAYVRTSADDAGEGVYLMPAPEATQRGAELEQHTAAVAPSVPSARTEPKSGAKGTTFLAITIVVGALGGAAAAAVMLRPPPSTTQPKASAAPHTSSTPAAAPTGSGRIRTEDWTRGRRLLLDGQYMGEGPGPLEVPCGSHDFQVGTGGHPHRIDVPCGGEVLAK